MLDELTISPETAEWLSRFSPEGREAICAAVRWIRGTVYPVPPRMRNNRTRKDKKTDVPEEKRNRR